MGRRHRPRRCLISTATTHPEFSSFSFFYLRDLRVSFYLFIYLFIIIIIIFGCIGSSLLRTGSSCGKRGLLFVALRGLITAAASLVAEHGL